MRSIGAISARFSQDPRGSSLRARCAREPEKRCCGGRWRRAPCSCGRRRCREFAFMKSAIYVQREVLPPMRLRQMDKIGDDGCTADVEMLEDIWAKQCRIPQPGLVSHAVCGSMRV